MKKNHETNKKVSINLRKPLFDILQNLELEIFGYTPNITESVNNAMQRTVEVYRKELELKIKIDQLKNNR